MSATRLISAAVFAALLLQTGNGEAVSALAIDTPEPASISQAEFDQFLADVRSASSQWFNGQKTDATAAMAGALERYANAQRQRYPERALSPVEQDVLAIRDAVRNPVNFKALGMGAAVNYRAAVLDPVVRVTLSNRSTGTVTIRRPLPNRPWTLYLDGRRTRQLASLLGDLEGSPWPDKGAAVAELWRQFVGVHNGHMSLWSVGAYPAVYEVTFLNAKRTRAEARVQGGDAAGTTAIFEKQHGQWVLTKVTGRWIA